MPATFLRNFGHIISNRIDSKGIVSETFLLAPFFLPSFLPGIPGGCPLLPSPGPLILQALAGPSSIVVTHPHSPLTVRTCRGLASRSRAHLQEAQGLHPRHPRGLNWPLCPPCPAGPVAHAEQEPAVRSCPPAARAVQHVPGKVSVPRPCVVATCGRGGRHPLLIQGGSYEDEPWE